MLDPRLVAVEPIGRKYVRDPLHGWASGAWPVYPPSPRGRELRDARVSAHVMLVEASRAAGLRISEWSALEYGSVVPRDGWDWLFAAVKRAAQ